MRSTARRFLATLPSSSSSCGMSMNDLTLTSLAMDHVSFAGVKNQADIARALARGGALKEGSAAHRALQSVDRAIFLQRHDLADKDYYAEPYTNEPQPLLGIPGATLSSPQHHATILSTLTERGALFPGAAVLDVGTGTGYLAACFASVALSKDGGSTSGKVVATERADELVSQAKKCLELCPVTAGEQGRGRLEVRPAYERRGWALEKQTYDLVHLGFSLNPETNEAELENVVNSLTSNGVAILGWGAELSLFSPSKERVVVARIPGMASMLPGNYVKPPSRTERLEVVKRELDAWKADYAAKNEGKAPNRDALFGDPRALALFQEFSKLNR